MGLFSGLSKYGLSDMEKMDLYESSIDAEKDASAKNVKKTQKEFHEEDFLFDKSFVCPVCSKSFQAKQVRTGKVKLNRTDTDLRPVYDKLNSIKYDAIVCPKCGYAAMSRYFNYILPKQAEAVLKHISANFQGLDALDEPFYRYETAIDRYKLALASCVVKKAKNSEKAYTCLKLAWLLRGKSESLTGDEPDYDETIQNLHGEELELLKNACDGFCEVYEKESFPICGMDEGAFSCMLGDLCRRVGRKDEAKRWISKVLNNRAVNERIKEKAREVKRLLLEEK